MASLHLSALTNSCDRTVMITSNSSPTIHTTTTRSSPSHAFSPRPQYENTYRPRLAQPAIRRTVSRSGSCSTIHHPGTTSSPRISSTRPLPISYSPGTTVETRSHSQPRDRLEGHQIQMVDAGTQYSPPKEPTCSQSVPASGVANLQLQGSIQPTTFAPIVSSPESPEAPTIAPRILDQSVKQVVQTPASTLHSGGSAVRLMSLLWSPRSHHKPPPQLSRGAPTTNN